MQKPHWSCLLSGLRYATLPLLAAVYPALFHYANNTQLVLFSSLIELSIFLAGIGLTFYLALGLLSRGKFIQAGIGTLLTLIFFHTYGLIYDGLRSLDLFQVEVYNFLPFYVFVALYLTWAVTRLDPNTSYRVWNASILVVGILTVFNIVKIIPVEIEKHKNVPVVNENTVAAKNETDSVEQYPDIYYLIFDEAAGFEVARQYWHYDGVNEFVDFLESYGFYVAEQSHAGSVITQREIAARLNYSDLPIDYEHREIYMEPLANNKVMEFLKNRGYKIVVYQEPQFVLPATIPRIPADYRVDDPPNSSTSASGVGAMDDFKRMVLDNTLLKPVVIGITPGLEKHRDFIFFTVQDVAALQVPSPKFTFVHMLLPHAPFFFDSYGGFTEPVLHYNWQAYLGTYQYSLKIAQQLILNILTSSNPKQPPVIILQSDHGVRNIQNKPFSGNLENYPEEYKTWIINALYLPGCEDAPLSQDMDPINTFPIVFNCYFDVNITLK